MPGCLTGYVAEWSGRGLQNLLRRFESARNHGSAQDNVGYSFPDVLAGSGRDPAHSFGASQGPGIFCLSSKEKSYLLHTDSKDVEGSEGGIYDKVNFML